MKHKLLMGVSIFLLMVLILLLAWRYVERTGQQQKQTGSTSFEVPTLGDADYDWIASGIDQNETGGRPENLTYWGAGEDFPSFGIGHFIWFPTGIDAPFDEQFPAMFSFVREASPADIQVPDWLRDLSPFDAPWTSKQQFDEARSSPQMVSLRAWLEQTRQYQARFIVSAFEQRWQQLPLSDPQKKHFSNLLRQLMATPEGLFAVIDYYNFKGMGNNARERYQGEGWGLVQVLEALSGSPGDDGDCKGTVEQFRDAAAARLRLRVALAPPQRNEARWLEGWLKRLDAYLVRKDAAANFGTCGFRVTPYLQNPSADGMTISWLSNDQQPGTLRLWRADSDNTGKAAVLVSSPLLADALAYHPAENCGVTDCSLRRLPYLHELRVSGLEPGGSYRYQVTQNGQQAGGQLVVPGGVHKAWRFIVYADSETEPESTGKHAAWPGDATADEGRLYPVDQTTGYLQNLRVIQQRRPAFIAIAGDLVQSGGEQRDWDEFWLRSAAVAASTVLIPALGNHEYFGGPGALGKYGIKDSERAVRKYRTYFDLPGNGAHTEAQAERYYVIRYGVVSLIVLDTNDGIPHRSDRDTNWRLEGEVDGGFAPDWHPGSEQYQWLEKELGRAQANGGFTFVMFHGAPYSSGYHGVPPGILPGRDILSAVPIRALTPLFLRYGVDAVFSGHDEMYEHSVVSGVEISPAGLSREHQLHFLDVGIGGDGLRGPVEGVVNPYQRFLAHTNAPETYGPDGVLLDGGKHYGHLEVNIEQGSTGLWQAKMDMVYIFPVLDVSGTPVEFERRLYNDSFILTTH